MHAGRKILNLRCDRKISQQDLARACGITPSALSKIEAGINSPRANIIWRIAQNLGVTVEYLLDEEIPYPFLPVGYRQELVERDVDPADRVKKEVSREESLFIDALRRIHPTAREVALSIPEASVETIRLIHFLVHHSQIENPGPAFREQFESLVKTGSPGEVAEEEKPKRKTRKHVSTTSARGTKKRSLSSRSSASSRSRSARGSKKKPTRRARKSRN